MSYNIVYILVLVFCVCQNAHGSDYEPTVHKIMAGSSRGSLSEYLHNNSTNQVLPSFTTLMFSSGLHDLCQQEVVSVKDVVNITLLGSEATDVLSIDVGNGRVVDVISPSTVISCRSCSTGFAFINVSTLTVKRIAFDNCGGSSMINDTSNDIFLSDVTLALVGVTNLTLDTVYFRNNIGKHSLIGIDIIGYSAISNFSVINNLTQHSLLNGGVEISFTKTIWDQSITNHTTAILQIDSVFMINIKSICLSIILSSCNTNISLTLNHIVLHSNFINVVDVFVGVFLIQSMKDAVGSQVHVSSIRISNTEQSFMSSAFTIVPHGIAHCSQSNRIQVPNKISVTGLEVSMYQGPRIIQIAKTTFSNSRLRLRVLFYQTELPSIFLLSTTDCLITVANTTIGRKRSSIITYQDGLFSANKVTRLIIENCNFVHNPEGPGLGIESSTITFKGNNTFFNNSAIYGGGILIVGHSLIYIMSNTSLIFMQNSAKITGGALHVDYDRQHDPTILTCELPACLFQLPWNENSTIFIGTSYAKRHDIHLTFINNTAGVAGQEIWGGYLDTSCVQLKCEAFSFIQANPLSISFDKCSSNCVMYEKNIFSVRSTNLDHDSLDPGSSIISSSPENLCFCQGDLICTENFKTEVQGPTFTLYPGQSLHINVAIVGQLDGLVSGLVQAELKNSSGMKNHFGNLQRTQRIVQAKCTELTYTIFSSVENSVISLYLFLAKTLDHESLLLNYETVSLNRSITSFVKLQSCPIGFQHNSSVGSCTCLHALLRYVVNDTCDIATQTVQRTPSLWIDAFFTDNHIQVLAAHRNCPFDYCSPNKIRIDLRRPDEQCAYNRSGTLCGGCKKGFSLTLGSAKCIKCSNKYVSILLVFPIAGILLIAFLTCLNFTVSVGTCNGLILYANIIQAIHPTFFPSTNLLSVFIAWVNLDLGIQTCLYDGLDFYGLTWLQFLFPVYVWLLVFLMIITSHYSSFAARLVSRDAVKVLATLYLLSYAKLLRVIITTYSFTFVNYENNHGKTYKHAVWLYDGNIEFGKGKHIPLLLVATGFGLLYIIPFTVLLLFSPLLQAKSHLYRPLKWVNKLMPFLDAYQGPYDYRFRFWSGLLLLTRIILLLSFALNGNESPQINLNIILTFTIALFSVQVVLGMVFKSSGLYRQSFINYIEVFFIANLGVLSTWSLLQTNDPNDSIKAQIAISSVCIGVSFFLCICILFYHAYQRIKVIDCFTSLLKKRKADCNHEPQYSEPPTATCTNNPEQLKPAVAPTRTVVEVQLREPLLTDS